MQFYLVDLIFLNAKEIVFEFCLDYQIYLGTENYFLLYNFLPQHIGPNIFSNYLIDIVDYISPFLVCFSPCLILYNVPNSNAKIGALSAFMSRAEKAEVSANIPLNFKEIIIGILLSDASLRMNGLMALLSVQQTHAELTNGLWQMCWDLKLILSNVYVMNRNHWKTIYAFQTLTLPFFTDLFKLWYTNVGGINVKVLPEYALEMFSELSFAFFIMGDGSWDASCGRIVLHVNNFTLAEVELIQKMLRSKFDIESYNVRQKNSVPERGYLIKIPRRDVEKVRELTKAHIYPSLQYKLGL